MISTETITIHTQNGKREVLISPILLQSKEAPPAKFDKTVTLYIYENWIDDEYLANLDLENLADKYKPDKYLINYGQDYSKFYLGSLKVNFEEGIAWDWQGQSDKFSNSDGRILEAALFSPDAERRQIIIFTPTRPSDFNCGHLKYLF